jgi:hypothetical protein
MYRSKVKSLIHSREEKRTLFCEVVKREYGASLENLAIIKEHEER